jgi:adenine/guanine phosphoribosyltransferase-like PRPP-binding protein
MLEPKRARYTVTKVVKMIKARGLEFDAIACRGLSALLIAPIVAMRLGKSLIVVRKNGEKNHSNMKVEGDHGARTYIILDDFIDSGDTVRAIGESIHKENKEMKCVGFIAYKRLSFKDAYDPFEEQMDSAWWDEKESPSRFFPEGVCQ